MAGDQGPAVDLRCDNRSDELAHHTHHRIVETRPYRSIASARVIGYRALDYMSATPGAWFSVASWRPILSFYRRKPVSRLQILHLLKCVKRDCGFRRNDGNCSRHDESGCYDIDLRKRPPTTSR